MLEFFEPFIKYIDNIKYEILLSIFMIFLLTFLQQVHFKILFKITKKTSLILDWFVRVLLRVGIILHEFAHLIMWFLFWAKIQKIELFSKYWWKVVFSMPDYLWGIWYYHSFRFYLMVIVSRIWIFLTSLSPLLVWIFFNTFLFYFLFWGSLFDFDELSFWFLNSLIFVVYALVFLPSFLLSYQDLKSMFLYNWKFLIDRIVWTVLNIFIVFFAIIGLWVFFEYLLMFFITYLLAFGWIVFIFWLNLIYNFFKNER